jgi:hypothetical protein
MNSDLRGDASWMPAAIREEFATLDRCSMRTWVALVGRQIRPTWPLSYNVQRFATRR